jgi:hypothetical protein
MKSKFSFIHKITAVLMSAAMFVPVFAIGANAQMMSKTKLKPLTEEQKILHVLNRLGFGARTGDVERVKTIGISKYIEQQLNPASISDEIADAKVKNLDVLKLSNEELFTKYPNQAAILMAVAQKNGLERRDLQGLRPNQNQPTEMKAGEMKAENDAQKQNELSAAEASEISARSQRALQEIQARQTAANHAAIKRITHSAGGLFRKTA